MNLHEFPILEFDDNSEAIIEPVPYKKVKNIPQHAVICYFKIPTSAVRDEGTSYHYLRPTREVEASPEGILALEDTLRLHNYKYLLTKTWTIDAIYRETLSKRQLRKSEQCLTVEMEAAALFAVAQFRKVIVAQVLYGSDDISGNTWDVLEVERKQIRETLFWLAVEACLRL